MRKPFQNWDMENFVGLAMLTIAALAGLVLVMVIGLLAWSMTQPATPTQTTMTETIQHGDLKWICTEWRTGQHVDAASCTLLDPMTGKTLNQ